MASESGELRDLLQMKTVNKMSKIVCERYKKCDPTSVAQWLNDRQP